MNQTGALEDAAIVTMISKQSNGNRPDDKLVASLLQQIGRNSDGKISLYEYIAWVFRGRWTLIPNAKARKASVMALIDEEMNLHHGALRKGHSDQSYAEKVSIWTCSVFWLLLSRYL